MRININKNRGLEMMGSVENDENKEYWVLIRVSPSGHETPASKLEEETKKVAACDGMAWIVPKEADPIVEQLKSIIKQTL